MIVKEITFETIKQYWIEVNHFNDPNKKIVEIIKKLGPYSTTYSDPRRISYGLFDKDRLIGVTHLVQWTENQVRYRTLNVRKEYRGNNLGWFLLENSYKKDWQGCGNLFGWIRDTHYNWAKLHNFIEVDYQWHDKHIAMERKM